MTNRAWCRARAGWGVVALGLLLPGCEAEEAGPGALVARSIAVHGGAVFEESEVRFRFREADFRVVRDGGRFVYERTLVDEEGQSVREGMDNDSTWRVVDGAAEVLDRDAREAVETRVNSVVYFGFLPFRLDDPAVRVRALPDGEVAGEPYRRVEVTFEEAGGGQDWEDRFVYWFHPEHHTLDFLAYRYYRDEGGTRFRRAVNRREIEGILVQDYENYAPLVEVDDIAEFGLVYARGELALVSLVELEEVEVRPLQQPPDED